MIFSIIFSLFTLKLIYNSLKNVIFKQKIAVLLEKIVNDSILLYIDIMGEMAERPKALAC